MMKAIIVDDEINSRKLLKNMLTGYCEGVEVIGMAANVGTGIDLIRENFPDILFLDIELPGGDGMAILEAFPDPDFRVVFVTGYNAYGLEYLALAALSWITKPVELGKLQQVVALAGSMLPTSRLQVEMIKEHQENEDPQTLDALILSSSGKHERIIFEDIAYLEANRAYASFHLKDGDERLAAFSLSHYETLLPNETFFRIHRSYLVNIDMVAEVEGGRGGMLLLKNGNKLPIATRRKGEFLKFLKA